MTIQPRSVRIAGRDEVLTPATIEATRQWYNANAQACIDEAVNGDVPVRDLGAYVEWQEASARQAIAGSYDNSLAFIQRAWFIQSGECVGILPPAQEKD